MSKPQEMDDRDEDDDADVRIAKQKIPGMIIPGMMTKQGKVKIIY